MLTTKELMSKETAKFGSVVILNPDPHKVQLCNALVLQSSVGSKQRSEGEGRGDLVYTYRGGINFQGRGADRS